MADEIEEITETPVETPTEEAPVETEKRRIKPVIEEVVADAPATAEVAKEGAGTVEDTETTPAIDVDDKPEFPDVDEKTEPVYEKPTELPVDDSKSDARLFIIIAIITAIVVAALAGGIYVYITGTKGIESLATPTPEATIPPAASPEASPEGSPSATLKLEEYKVQILNGSGKIGEANKAKAMLEKVGFEITNTGNAKTFDFTDTIIQAKESVSAEVLEEAENALSKTYSVKIGDNLDSDSDFDLVITVGSK